MVQPSPKIVISEEKATSIAHGFEIQETVQTRLFYC